MNAAELLHSPHKLAPDAENVKAGPQKRVDWLEFVFEDVPASSMELVETDRYINCGRYDGYKLGRYLIYKNREDKKFFVQWTGQQCQYFDPILELIDFCQVTGIDLDKIVIKRIDLAFDIPQKIPKEFIDRERFRTRAKKFGYFISGRGGQTIYFGSRKALQLRMYDKKAELLEKRPDKFAHYMAATGFDPAGDVTRVEYMVRSKALRRVGIQNARQLWDNLESLEAYLVREWCWVPRTKDRHKKHDYHPFWDIVASMVGTDFHVCPVEKEAVHSKTLSRSAHGTYATAYASQLKGNETWTIEGFREYVLKELTNFVPDGTWNEYFGSRLE